MIQIINPQACIYHTRLLRKDVGGNLVMNFQHAENDSYHSKLLNSPLAAYNNHSILSNTPGVTLINLASDPGLNCPVKRPVFCVLRAGTQNGSS